MSISNPINERRDPVKARLKDSVEFTESLHHPGALLRHDFHAFDDECDDKRADENADSNAWIHRQKTGGSTDDDSDNQFYKHGNLLTRMVNNSCKYSGKG